MEILTPVKAIRAKCLDCSGGSRYEVEQCVITDCPLYPYRLGKNPNRKGQTLTDEQKAARTKNLRKAREAKGLVHGSLM